MAYVSACDLDEPMEGREHDKVREKVKRYGRERRKGGEGGKKILGIKEWERKERNAERG